ncbi:hypothetical protein BJ165DRAFT_1521356 [Panaeolus papilionaceus]|nr:hypothetical protein BJ165DRAFT_1521356 [Panaeolus papilionaceus]
MSLISLGKKRSLIFYINAFWAAFSNRTPPFHLSSTSSYYSTFRMGVKVFMSLITLGTRLQNLPSTDATTQAHGHGRPPHPAAGWLGVAASVPRTLEESTAQGNGVGGTGFTVREEPAQSQRDPRGPEERQSCKPPQSTNAPDSEDTKPGSPPLPHHHNRPPSSHSHIRFDGNNITGW